MTRAGHHPIELLGLLARRVRTWAPRTYKVGRHRIDLPAGHLLDWYRFRHSRYSEPVADISAILADKHRRFEAIDIGANIGSTAAQIVQSENVRVLCVEGNEKFIPLLARNLARISPTSELAACYVGASDSNVAGVVRIDHGTAAIEISQCAASNGPTVRLHSLAAILAEHESFRAARLVKIDTDGFDAKIVIGSKDLFARMRPALFVEYSPVGKSGAGDEYYAMIEILGEIGYRWFHLFDNFGNHMLRLSVDERSHLRELGAYVRSSCKDAKPAVFYFDVCALTDDDRDVSDRLVSRFLLSNP